MKNRMMALVIAVCMLLAGFPPALAEERVSISADTDTLVVAAGKTVRLKLTVEPYAARKAGVTYQSDNESIATVDRRGNVKGIAQGSCQIAVTSKLDPSTTLLASVLVVVPVKKLKADIADKSIRVGQTTAIALSYEPGDATLKQAVYASSNKDVATVDEKGVVTGLGRGQATITVRSADGAAKTTVRVKVIQQPTSISVSPNTLVLTTGKKGALKASVLPKNADNKRVVWSSSDESVATVDSRGRVTSLSSGEATIIAACEDDPSISASVPITNVQLAKAVAFDRKSYEVVIGRTVQLNATVLPEDTANKTVAYKVKNAKIASVDENGLVTGLKGGKTSVTATTADGSQRRVAANIQVIVPVTGVSYKHTGMRVGAGSHTYLTATLEPSDATNKHMTWASSDESVATVKGNTNKVRVQGRGWGRCQMTGTTEDGGYSITLDVNVGSLRRAVVVESIEIRDGRPYIVLKNHSDMNITSVSYAITGRDAQGDPIQMSTRGDTMYGVYDLGLAPGEKTRHGHFNFFRQADYSGLESVSIAITGWETDTGYYDNDGGLHDSYDIPSGSQDWITWESDVYKKI